LVALLTTGGIVSCSRSKISRTWIVGALVFLIFVYQAVCDTLILRTRKGTHLLRAGQAIARVSDPDDLILVLSDNPSTVDGAPNNYQQPDVFFHSHRRGRALAVDRQTRGGIEEALAPGVKWFVNFPPLNDVADPTFFDLLQSRMTIVVEEDDFEIYSIGVGSSEMRSPYP
jgi:hypothetical protein